MPTIRLIFFFRDPALICFSRAIARCASGNDSRYTSFATLYRFVNPGMVFSLCSATLSVNRPVNPVYKTVFVLLVMMYTKNSFLIFVMSDCRVAHALRAFATHNDNFLFLLPHDRKSLREVHCSMSRGLALSLHPLRRGVRLAMGRRSKQVKQD